MGDKTSAGEQMKRGRRSPEFMRHVSNCMDVGMSFIDAVRDVSSRADEIAQHDSANARRAMRTANQLATWNASVPIGTPVMFRRIVDGPEFPSKTRSKAWALGHGRNVVLIDGKSGGWCLDFIRVVADVSNESV